MAQTKDTLLYVGKQHGMSEQDVATCEQDQAQFDKLTADQQYAVQELKVTSTPTFFLNGVMFRGSMPFEELEERLLPLLAKVAAARRSQSLLSAAATSPMMTANKHNRGERRGRSFARSICSGVAAVRCRGVIGGKLPGQAGARRGRVPRRRTDRRHCPHRRPEADRQSRPAILRREHRRRRRQHRGRPGRARDAGRLHHHGHQHRLRRQSQPLRQGAVRSDQGFRAGDAGGGLAEYRCGQSASAGQDAAGTGAADQGQSRQIQFCRPGRRIDAASRRRIVPPRLQARSGARAVHGSRAGGPGNGRRPYADRIHRSAILPFGGAGRATACPWRRVGRTGPPGCPMCRPMPNRA